MRPAERVGVELRHLHPHAFGVFDVHAVGFAAGKELLRQFETLGVAAGFLDGPTELVRLRQRRARHSRRHQHHVVLVQHHAVRLAKDGLYLADVVARALQPAMPADECLLTADAGCPGPD